MLKVLVVFSVLTAVCNAGLRKGPGGPLLSYGYPHGPAYGYAHGYGPYGYGAPAVVKKVVEVPEPAPAPAPVGATPYEFGYDITDEEGNRQSRKESGDAAGNQKGSYGFSLADGRRREVDYVANGDGFKAVVRTNEEGTDPEQDPADVQIEPLPRDVKIVKRVEPAPVKIVKVAPSYLHGYGYGYGHGYHGVGGYSGSYGKRYEGGPYGLYGRLAPSYSYGHSYFPGYRHPLW